MTITMNRHRDAYVPLGVSLTTSTRDAAQAEADRRGMTRSAYIRSLILADLGLDPTPVRSGRAR